MLGFVVTMSPWAAFQAHDGHGSPILLMLVSSVGPLSLARDKGSRAACCVVLKSIRNATFSSEKVGVWP